MMRRRPARDAPETLRGNMQIKVVARARETLLCFQNHSPNREIMGAESHPCGEAQEQNYRGWDILAASPFCTSTSFWLV